MSEKKTRIAVVGVGGIGTKAHIPAYLKNQYVDLVALVDADKIKLKKTAKKFRIKSQYSSIDDLLENQELDGISICTPPSTHAEIALKALDKDVNVLCEKPMATSTDDGRRMYEKAREKGKLLMIGFNLRYQPNYKLATEHIQNGRVGHAYLVECNNLSANPLLNWSKSTWFFDPKLGGGVLADKGPHVFDLLNYVFDDFPCSVSAISSTFFDCSVEDSCVCALEYSKGRIGIGKMSWLSSHYVESINVYGSAQSIFATPNLFLEENATDYSQVILWSKASRSLLNLKFPNFPFLHGNKVDSFQLEIDQFINQVRTNQNYSPTALSGLNVLLTSDAAKKSLETKKKVSFIPFRNER